MTWLYLALAFSFNASANILLKLGSRTGFNWLSNSPLELFVANWQFIVGCLLFAANVPFYFLALRAMPISIAYPLMVVMSFILINIYALGVLGEQLNWWQVIGYVCLVVGLILVVANQS